MDPRIGSRSARWPCVRALAPQIKIPGAATARDPAGGAFSAPPDRLAGFKGLKGKDGREGKRGKGRGKKDKGTEWKEKGGG